jgi:hypothetical protein
VFLYCVSLLARETNWLERITKSSWRFRYFCNSLLARETNWLESYMLINTKSCLFPCISLLARETNWLESGAGKGLEAAGFKSLCSLLARETNWLEREIGTQVYYQASAPAPYSLGKLIDWKVVVGNLQSFRSLKISLSLLARETNWLERRFFCDCIFLHLLPTR